MSVIQCWHQHNAQHNCVLLCYFVAMVSDHFKVLRIWPIETKTLASVIYLFGWTVQIVLNLGFRNRSSEPRQFICLRCGRLKTGSIFHSLHRVKTFDGLGINDTMVDNCWSNVAFLQFYVCSEVFMVTGVNNHSFHHWCGKVLYCIRQ